MSYHAIVAPSCVMEVCKDDKTRPLVVTRVRVCAECQRDHDEEKRLWLWVRLNGYGAETVTHGTCGPHLSKIMEQAGTLRQKQVAGIQRLG